MPNSVVERPREAGRPSRGPRLGRTEKPGESRERKLHMGYGACSISGCPCQAYTQSYGSELCGNCGHKYTDHW